MKQLFFTIFALILALGVLTGVRTVASAGEPPVFQYSCGVAKTAKMDPITDDPSPHKHIFYGNKSVNWDSTYRSLVSHKNTTCKLGFVTTSYWHPAVRFGAVELKPRFVTVYYFGHGNLRELRHIPDGLKMIGRESNGDVDYVCGRGTRKGVENPPYGCAAEKFRIRVHFPNCWDRSSLRPESLHEGPTLGTCRNGMVKIPQLRVSIHYHLDKPLASPMRVSAGGGEWKDKSFMHADAFEANQQPKFNETIKTCVMEHVHARICTRGM